MKYKFKKGDHFFYIDNEDTPYIIIGTITKVSRVTHDYYYEPIFEQTGDTGFSFGFDSVVAVNAIKISNPIIVKLLYA